MVQLGGSVDDYPVHRKKDELIGLFKYYARNRDEEGFKRFLAERKIEPHDERYAPSMSAFWNLVRSIENEPSR